MPLHYDCSKCPAYCCTYDEINVSERDIRRLARHFELDPEVARKRFTKMVGGKPVLRHQKDAIYGSAGGFPDLKRGRCTRYGARRGACPGNPSTQHGRNYD